MPVKKKTAETNDAVIVEPVPITLGDTVKIKYKGDLLADQADRVYLHAGFGRNGWEKVSDILMKKGRDGRWTASIEAKEPSCLNFCFHDSADNWDNNNGNNWTYEIHHGGK